MTFLQSNIINIFDSAPTLFPSLTMETWKEIFAEPLTLIQDKFGRQCDVLETTENLFHILINTLKTSKRFEELQNYMENCVIKEYLYGLLYCCMP